VLDSCYLDCCECIAHGKRTAYCVEIVSASEVRRKDIVHDIGDTL
jgi:hypothetical protein